MNINRYFLFWNVQKKVVIIGFLLGAGLIVFQYLENSYYDALHHQDFYLLLISVAFLSMGILIGKKVKGKKIIEIIEPAVDDQMIKMLGISSREMEVLDHLAKGHSNQEIADLLFVSLNTIKTHISNLYIKLDVDKRTKAISRAKQLKLLI